VTDSAIPIRPPSPQNDKRELHDWLTEFVSNTKWGEAPDYFYFWVGVGTIASALRRQVWLNMGTFHWFPNLYILLVAPPGVIQKSSTADLGLLHLLKKIEGINFGPSTVTWQALYDAFAEVGEAVDISPELQITQSALVINSSEFGITLNPKDTEMVDQLVHIWDGREMAKRTRKDGLLVIPTPCLNMIACTTPAWIAENMPRYLIGGGLTSRMLFVYGEEKARYIAYPWKHMPVDYEEFQAKLVRDLKRISMMKGEFRLTPEAVQWGEDWYERFHKVEKLQLDPTLIGGYIARKQTLVHKVAMIMSASQGDSMEISLLHLQRAVGAITELEKNMPLVYSKIGMTKESNAGEQIIAYLNRYGGKVAWAALFQYMHRTFPKVEEVEDILRGLIEAGYVNIDRAERTVILLKRPE
jgi:hypothetical protein